MQDSGSTGGAAASSSFDSTGGELELYTIFLTGGATNPPFCEGKITATARFASVAWSPYTGTAQQYPCGLIAGGMSDGTIHFYDPAAIMSSSNGISSTSSSGREGATSTNALLGTLKAQSSSGPIAAMQFSSLDTYRLCAGAFNGRVSILDCTDPTAPTSSEPGPPGQAQPSVAEITAVAWNTAVAHIVATAAGDGVVTVWDIQSHKAWCEIRAESAGQAVADIVWNPAQGLHLLTASADDRNPVLRVWDLGASTSVPLATLSGHAAGLFRASWCPHDDALLLSVSKDNRTLLWDLHTLTAVAELPIDAHLPQPSHHHHPAPSQHSAGALFASGRPGLSEQKQMRYDVQWSPFQRGVALTCSLDRKVQFHSLLALATLAGRPPAWMMPQSSVSTGFGGTLVTCGIAGTTGSTVTIHTIQEQPLLAETSMALEADLAYYQATNIIEFCKLQQEKVSIVKEDKALWGFMQVIFETNARHELLRHLGFDAGEIAAAANQYTDDLAHGKSSSALSVKGDDDERPTGMSPVLQELVKKALLVGNFEAAVECCFETGNYADALMLASCGGGDLLAKTQERYFVSESSKRPFLSLVSGIIRNQLDELVASADTSTWHEMLAILSTYAQSEEFPTLCILLGDRLQEAGDDSNASLCYMCALNLERSVEFWKKQLHGKVADADFSSTSDLLALHEFVVKVSVFMHAAGPAAVPTPEIEELYTKYSQALAEQGLLVTAVKYCSGSSTLSKELRDRLYRSRASHRCYAVLGSAPEFPYAMVDIQQSRGQVMAQPIVQQVTTNGQDYNHPQASVPQEQQAYGQQQAYAVAQQQQGYTQGGLNDQQGYQTQNMLGTSDALPPGWVALNDAGSGNTYYANETTGETTWDRPQVPGPVPSYSALQRTTQDAGFDTSQRSSYTNKSSDSKQQKPTLTSKPSLVSKYGDGFVTSASNPELANQYGNVGTSNPYGGIARPGTAAAVVQTPLRAPVSGSLNFDSLQLSNHHNSIKDTLLGVTTALDGTSLNPVEKRQLLEAEKGVAILVKKLAMNALSGEVVEQVFSLVSAVSNRDFGIAMAVQTLLANSEWREHKDWLKGIKILIQIAAKKL